MKKIILGLTLLSIMSATPTLTAVAQQNRVGVKVGFDITPMLDNIIVRTDGNNNIIELAESELSNMAINK
jgi:hypothetical protein